MNILQDKDRDSKTGPIIQKRTLAYFLIPIKHWHGGRVINVLRHVLCCRGAHKNKCWRGQGGTDKSLYLTDL